MLVFSEYTCHHKILPLILNLKVENSYKATKNIIVLYVVIDLGDCLQGMDVINVYSHLNIRAVAVNLKVQDSQSELLMAKNKCTCR